ncbi:MAG: multifunctional oxoglutarate decarboxylase/oxoglutarate dehydrogenase thiamine pyrophosphate-binding subunit/dihydrolipoyllysine-residue succinyltransferase subunit, partial [Acidimicrobiia bacterium]
MTARSVNEDFGANSGIVDDMYRQFLENPDAVSESWRDFFAGYSPRVGSGANGAAPTPLVTPAQAPTPVTTPAATAATAPAPNQSVAPAPKASVAPASTMTDGDTTTPLRGVAARIVENMEASLAVPTATSVRAVPAKLLEVNRRILNNHLARVRGPKVSFTHLIAYATARAVAMVPAMQRGYVDVDGQPTMVQHAHCNLGLAVDVTKSDGTRTLMVPNVKHADSLDFAAFFHAYEDLIRKVRTNALTLDDFAGTTGSVTNPGMIGTVHSVPRLMPGQGFILGVGAIEYPAEYQGADPSALAQIGVSKVVTLTSTYDHRVIQGAESGEFLRAIHELLLGEHGFYDEVFRSFAVPYEPARWRIDETPLDEVGLAEKVVSVYQLINMYRVRGHLLANIDPLGRREPVTHEELDIAHYGLSIWDLERVFPSPLANASRRQTLGAMLQVLRDAYARSIGIEYMHVQDPEVKLWIQDHFEIPAGQIPIEGKKRLLEKLNNAEAFERFLQTKFIGHKRFGLEGAESLIPMLDVLLSDAADDGVEAAVLGMAHRGRLNVLTNIVGKSYSQIFREFEGELDPNTTQGSGDVKYHVGARGTHVAPSGNEIAITLASNPSHLEAVDPVVVGMARAKQDEHDDVDRAKVLPVLIHGDAAFAGQGVVAETFNLSEVEGYNVGGTVHIIINNQVGFTTDPGSGRSGYYCTDIAKMVQAPIFHVNGDDPEACLRVMRIAFAFRQEFNRDVVIDMYCYRRHGHNETDEPAYTQPSMYALIEQKRSVRKLYTETLVNRGDLSLEEAEAALEHYRVQLEGAFDEIHQTERHAPTPVPSVQAIAVPSPNTGVSRSTLEHIVDAITTWPAGFTVHPKLEKILLGQKQAFGEDVIDWALGEQFALGSLLMEGAPIRMVGQDTRRGTFSHRHAVLVDATTEQRFTPLADLSDTQARLSIYDSVLSEFAALGFEYGYSVARPHGLVVWEAQFGDFANGAQTI